MSIEETGNVDVTTSSPLPAAETESVSETVVEEVIKQSKFRESLVDFSSEVSAVVNSNMSDRDAFALCRKLFRELRVEKQRYFPIKNLKAKKQKKGNVRCFEVFDLSLTSKNGSKRNIIHVVKDIEKNLIKFGE